MKKLNRREKTYLRLALLAILVAILSKGSDYYYAAKEKLEADNTSLEENIALFAKKMETESADKYREESAKLNDTLKASQLRVLELNEEANANLFLSQIISDRAEAAGMVLSAVSNRKAKVISEEAGLWELRTYFGFDTDLSSMLTFFTSMDEQEFYVSIENLTITARRTPVRNTKRKDRIQRKPLNGSAVLTTVFHPNPEASLDRYESILAAARANTKKLPEESPIVAEDEESDEEEPAVPIRNNKGAASVNIPRPKTALPGHLPPTETVKKPPVQIIKPQPEPEPEPEAAPVIILDPNPEQEAQKKSEPQPSDSEDLDNPAEGVEGGDRPPITIDNVPPPRNGDAPRSLTQPVNRPTRPPLNSKPRALSHTAQGAISSDH